MVCQNCGAPCKEGEKDCAFCGSRLSQQKTTSPELSTESNIQPKEKAKTSVGGIVFFAILVVIVVVAFVGNRALHNNTYDTGTEYVELTEEEYLLSLDESFWWMFDEMFQEHQQLRNSVEELEKHQKHPIYTQEFLEDKAIFFHQRDEEISLEESTKEEKEYQMALKHYANENYQMALSLGDYVRTGTKDNLTDAKNRIPNITICEQEVYQARKNLLVQAGYTETEADELIAEGKEFLTQG